MEARTAPEDHRGWPLARAANDPAGRRLQTIGASGWTHLFRAGFAALLRLECDGVEQPWRLAVAKERLGRTKIGNGNWTQLARDDDAVKERMRRYMDFAWEKANHRRGLSAGRSITQMSAWLWLLGRDAAAEQIRDYDQSGKPRLRAICEAFGWDWKQWDDGEWSNDEAAAGTPPPAEVEALK